ncbi:unnamed protein product [Lathyrus sativus]|nr:unnamed protein product [Lathyrus sativus]
MNIIKSNKACAACKHQRRKCSSDCILAPYFPVDKPLMFHNALNLYGVSNIIEILNKIPQEMRDLAMKTIIYESNVRAIYPIHGCLGVIKEICDRINENLEELYHVKELLDYCKINNLQSQNLSTLLPSTSSQNPNLQPHVSNIPIFNDVGNVSNYCHNSESNIEAMTNAYPSHLNDIIPREVNNTPTNTNLNISPMDVVRVAQLSEGVSNNKEYDLHGGGVDTQTSAKVDLKEKETPFNVNDLFIPDSEIDKVYYNNGQLFIENDSSKR